MTVSLKRPLIALAALLCANAPAFADKLNETLGNKVQFSKFKAALNAAGLDQQLAKPGEYTVFAPTDAALEGLANGAWATLSKPDSKVQLAAFLKQHIVKGKYTSRRLVATKTPRFTLTSLGGAPISIDRSKVLKAGGVALYHLDIDADNGVVHTIDQPLPTALVQKLTRPAAPTKAADAKAK